MAEILGLNREDKEEIPKVPVVIDPRLCQGMLGIVVLRLSSGC